MNNKIIYNIFIIINDHMYIFFLYINIVLKLILIKKNKNKNKEPYLKNDVSN